MRRALAALSLAAWLAGCPAAPLDRQPAPAAQSPRGFELYLPDGRIAELGEALLEVLRADGQAELRAAIAGCAGSLDEDQTGYALPARELALGLEEVVLSPLEGGLELRARVAGLDEAWALDLTPPAGAPRTCALTVRAPPRAVEAAWLLRADVAERPALVPGQPASLGEPGVEIGLDPACTVLDTSALVAEVAAAVEAALRAGLDDLVARVGVAAGGVLGLDARHAGSLEGRFRYLFQSGGAATSLSRGRLRIGLPGGFEGELDPCAPPALAVPAPGAGEAADFADLLPGAGTPFGLALAVPRATLEQALRVAHRAGLLCKRAGEAPLEGVSLEELLPSLSTLGSLNGARAAVWPEGAPELSLEQPGGPEERLPRAVVRLPGVGVDVYADLDGADVRVLGCEAEVFLTLSPSLDADGLRVRLVEARVGNLEIGFALLPAESGSALRQAAAALLGRLAVVLLAGLPPLALPWPAAGRGEVLEALTDAQAVVVYLAP